MKAIILSAGQGRRLLPLTAEQPKCLLTVDGSRSMLEVQLDALAHNRIEHVTVMSGFRADQVERLLGTRSFAGLEVVTRFNPFFATTDNLITCWLAAPEMQGDFVLLNGDTLFEPELLNHFLSQAQGPVSIAIDRKAGYDDDDMKVSLSGERRVRAIGKKLPDFPIDGEAIGASVFRGMGAAAFRSALDTAVRRPEAMRAWYPSVLNALAGELPVQAVSIHGLWWTEIDSQDDLEDARIAFSKPRH